MESNDKYEVEISNLCDDEPKDKRTELQKKLDADPVLTEMARKVLASQGEVLKKLKIGIVEKVEIPPFFKPIAPPSDIAPSVSEKQTPFLDLNFEPQSIYYLFGELKRRGFVNNSSMELSKFVKNKVLAKGKRINAAIDTIKTQIASKQNIPKEAQKIDGFINDFKDVIIS